AARMGEVRARAIEAEQVRKARHGDAEIRARLVPPLLAKRHARAADDLHRPEEAVRVKSRREDDDVDRVLAAAGAAHVVGRDLAYAVGHEIDVLALEGREPAPVVL